MALDFKVSTANDCNSYKFTSTTSYCEDEYDVEYIVPQVSELSDLGNFTVKVTADNQFSTGIVDTTNTTDIKWTWIDNDGVHRTLYGATATIDKLQNTASPHFNYSSTTVINLTVNGVGGSVLTNDPSMQFLVTTDASGAVIDYFIPNINITVSNPPTAHFTSDFLRDSLGSTYAFTSYQYRRYSSDPYIALVSNAVDLDHDYSTASTPGLPTGDQFFEYNVTFDGSTAISGFIGLSITASTDNCDGEIVKDEVTSAILNITDPDGNQDALTLTLADFISGATITIDSDDLTNTSIKDGIYTFDLTAYTTNNSNALSFNKFYKIPFTCNIKCKIYDLLYDAINDDCNCDDFTATKKWAAILAESMRRSALRAAGCNKVNHFNTLIAKIDDFLANVDCKNC